MPASKSSLITLQDTHASSVHLLFSKALELKQKNSLRAAGYETHHSGYKGTAALLFFEPSTRTRFSFESACSRAGYHPLILDGGIGTSLEKGETIEDTIYNIQAIRPDFFVIRCHDHVDLQQIDRKLQVPVINAGWGRKGHPTQALLDALTIVEQSGKIEGKNILFVGDIRHSRVVASHTELAAVLGYHIAFCGPDGFMPLQPVTGAKLFGKIDEALDWADAVIALRVQKERHDNENIFLIEDYRENFGLNAERLQKLRQDVLIMHPGPVNYGVEIETDVLRDSRCKILAQVENGAFLREALIRELFANRGNR